MTKEEKETYLETTKDKGSKRYVLDSRKIVCFRKLLIIFANVYIFFGFCVGWISALRLEERDRGRWKMEKRDWLFTSCMFFG